MFQDNNYWYIHGLVQDCSISSALTVEILQFCTKPSIYYQLSMLNDLSDFRPSNSY